MADTNDTNRGRGGRPRKGTVIPLPDGRLQPVITLPGGGRKRMKPLPLGTSRAMAEERAAYHTGLAEKLGATRPTVKGEAPAGSVSAWFEDFCKARSARGLTSVSDDRGRFTNHVEPVIGALKMTSVVRADIERLVRALDEKVRAGVLSWKTAQNTWVLVSKMFREAVRSKVPELRVRDSNPCTDVAPPDRGVHKAKAYLFPSELLSVLSCPRVNLYWKRAITLSVYLGTRAGELDALEWSDVDLEHGIVHIHRSADRTRAGEKKATKTGLARRVRIEPALLPLLKAMHEESGGSGLVCPAASGGSRSARLRVFLKRAKVERSELHAATTDTARKPLGWHDLRATNATWLAVRGDEPLRIMQRLGHRNFATTMLYVREAEGLREEFGQPFPMLPADLLKPESAGSFDRESIGEDLSMRKNWVDDGDRIRPETRVSREKHDPADAPSVETSATNVAKSADLSQRSISSDRSDDTGDEVERALADALRLASQAGQWTTVEVLSRELSARRLARTAPSVPTIEGERAKRGRGGKGG